MHVSALCKRHLTRYLYKALDTEAGGLFAIQELQKNPSLCGLRATFQDEARHTHVFMSVRGRFGLGDPLVTSVHLT